MTAATCGGVAAWIGHAHRRGSGRPGERDRQRPAPPPGQPCGRTGRQPVDQRRPQEFQVVEIPTRAKKPIVVSDTPTSASQKDRVEAVNAKAARRKFEQDREQPRLP